jgi:hypothetical protein
MWERCLALGMVRTTLKTSHVIAMPPVHWRADCWLATSHEHSVYCCVTKQRTVYQESVFAGTSFPTRCLAVGVVHVTANCLVMKPYVVAVYLNGLHDLKTGVKNFRMIQEAGLLQPLEMQTQSQMFVKWRCEIVEGLSE